MSDTPSDAYRQEMVRLNAGEMPTPTDDEREALISAARKEADQRYGVTDWTDGPGSSTFRRVDRGKAGAFVDGALWRDRRGQGEPSDDPAPRGWRSAPTESEPDRIERVEPEGEPSEAQYPEVDAFAARMRAEMIANSHKGDNWRGMMPRQAWGEISWHLGKLTAALKAEDVPAIRELAADIANGAMMLDQIVSIYDARAAGGAR